MARGCYFREGMDRVAYISRLSLTNFRNLVELELDLLENWNFTLHCNKCL